MDQEKLLDDLKAASSKRRVETMREEVKDVIEDIEAGEY